MAKKRIHKYYLRLDGKVISFERFPEFKNIDDLLILSLFTGLFRDKYDLAETLFNLGLIESSECMDIDIVRKSSPYKGEDYYLIATSPVYKDSVHYLSSNAIRNFFEQNRKDFVMMNEVLDEYLRDAKKLVSIFEDKIHQLELDIHYDPSNKDLRFELEKRQNSYRNFCGAETNISRILKIVEYLSRDKVGFDREIELEYIMRVDNFVVAEANYLRGSKRTKNVRGCVKLALKIAKMHKKYPNLFRATSTQYSKEHLSLLKALRGYLDGTLVPVAPKAESPKKRKKVQEEEEDETEFEDPDTFMFLEREDYERLLYQPGIVDNEDGSVTVIPPGEPSSEAIESVAAAIEDLDDKQRRYGGK